MEHQVGLVLDALALLSVSQQQQTFIHKVDTTRTTRVMHDKNDKNDNIVMDVDGTCSWNSMDVISITSVCLSVCLYADTARYCY
ncbi:hypothetical protein DFA_05189 [Cavenderia fasciculata]|uniref:Uncharacterized protein n=1 Tax=Cavenderia fasciculata TaxID=261658 RepID=F4PNK6_CACFS|nr:uncharacterized protein DFA_05189 [Cavenderia fasciculata]EGG23059.1 hypothetical protein DFA_05189 [Cavenderia fasciculata]|eukprot:XP_004360910.1 hypothetical protein DFA_05189 [Cavenderia fasciculata]